MIVGTDAGTNHVVDQQLALRASAVVQFFTRERARIAWLCHDMAQRFERGGRLIAIAYSAAARSDARHIAVEFVHPVIVGKRALPALAITGSAREIEVQLGLLAMPNDIVIDVDTKTNSVEIVNAMKHAIHHANSVGCSSIAFQHVSAGTEFELPTDDSFIQQEVSEMLYHMLWELVHVYFDHGSTHHANAAVEAPAKASAPTAFLYPFLERQEQDVHALHRDVQQSIMMKAEESIALASSTIGLADSPNRRALLQASTTLREAFNAGGTLMAFGNGGSATDAMDAVADYRFPPGAYQSRRALDLADDSAIITALTNDVGADVIFSRQIIAHARPNDVVVAFSTSGNSRNVIHALLQARRQQLRSIAFVGYDGGQISHEHLAHHVIVSQSQHIPRIQEAQAAAHHVLRVLVG